MGINSTTQLTKVDDSQRFFVAGSHAMLGACEGCSGEWRVERAARQQTWAMGTVAGGIDNGVALGALRDRQFQLAANVRGHDDLLGSSSGSAGTGQHERLARLPSALAIALRELAAAQAIAIAEEQRRPVTAVALAEQLSSAAPARV